MNAAPGDDARAAAPLKIAYLCSLYPAVSHTFVMREIEALRKLGVEILTLSIHRTPPEQLLAAADHDAFDSTYAILPPSWPELLKAHLGLLRRTPGAYLSTLALALRLAPAGARGLLWQLFYLTEAVMLWERCCRAGIRHIHVHMGNVAADAALLAAHLGSAADAGERWTWSFTLHGPDELFDVRHFRLAEKVRRAEFVVCISDFTRSQLLALAGPGVRDKLKVVHVGIPIERFTRHAPPAPRAGPSRVLFVGRHVPQKGHVTLLEATKLLVEEGHDVLVTLAGEGPLRGTLEDLARELGIASRVSFPGAVGQDDIHSLYAATDVFCLPSYAEGVPTVLMEAMAMEIPVISTRITGVPELIRDGESGLLVTPARAGELAEALRLLIVNPSLRGDLGRAGRATVLEQFDARSSAQQLHDLLEALLAAGPPTSAPSP
jgi:colanic acid/amylovoran biosynthesis glycosyltransferase